MRLFLYILAEVIVFQPGYFILQVHQFEIVGRDQSNPPPASQGMQVSFRAGAPLAVVRAAKYLVNQVKQRGSLAVL